MQNAYNEKKNRDKQRRLMPVRRRGMSVENMLIIYGIVERKGIAKLATIK